MEKIVQFGPRRLAKGEVHLWFFRDQGEKLPHKAEFLDSDELQRLSSYKVAVKQREFLIGRWFMKKVLAQYTANPYSAISFSPNKHGRLRISGTFDINLSHSFGGYCCALSCVGRVGVDVEYLQREVKTQAAHHVFSPEEIAALEKLSGDSARQLFFQIWTMKEAVWKAIDLGNRLNFNAFYVDFHPLSLHTHTDILPTEGWQLNNIYPHREYMISTAIFAPGHSPLQLKTFYYMPENSHL